ncbi:MAG: hypothetical protein N3G19_00330 [Candidatus Pacearchaeota archaeon]|nr:hypothetical protein [Candidatus Pacearchaeota archaeon]
MNKNKRDIKKGVEWEVIAWIIAIAVFIFLTILIAILRKQGFDLIEWIKNFLRFGR